MRGREIEDMIKFCKLFILLSLFDSTDLDIAYDQRTPFT